MTRLLVLMRHAKAESYAATDAERALTDRGRADAAAAGLHLRERGIVPDHALVSAARRTVETWAEVRAATGSEVQADVSQALYSATPASALESLRGVPADSRVVCLVGHNPTVAELVLLLDDQEGDPAAVVAATRGMPTAALAVLDVGASWQALEPGHARLVAFHAARM